jgi:endonuclease/exonuclease/phosphatase family metal-dependent hydrolase
MGLNLSERLNAVKTICALIDSCDLPVVLMGDFNTLPDAPELQPIRDRLKDTTDLDSTPNAFSFPSDVPRIKIDYIFYRGMECVKTTTINEIYADHLPIIAEFKHI